MRRDRQGKRKVTPSKVGSETPGAARGTETILLVEDEALVRKATGRMLKSLGYNVLEAESGEAALELLNTLEDPIQLLLTDVMLPGINGLQLYHQVKKIRPGIKAMYVSGYSADAIANQCAPVDGTFTFLAKPFDTKTLAAKIRQLLD
jgi:two-component system cell cycle sensor histidine kinase/response regulator CckA